MDRRGFQPRDDDDDVDVDVNVDVNVDVDVNAGDGDGGASADGNGDADCGADGREAGASAGALHKTVEYVDGVEADLGYGVAAFKDKHGGQAHSGQVGAE